LTKGAGESAMSKYAFAALIALLVSGTAQAAGEMLNKECAACHQLSGAPVQTLKEAFAKKGPDLSYAGNKYREAWLVSWLQKPTRIRPAGLYYADHIKPGPKSDEVDSTTLKDHVAVAKDDAVVIAAELMKLRPHDDLIAKEKIEPGSIDRQMGEMTFDKFWGCMACHLIEPDFGGFSGPEVYTAGQRLQPEFIASFIRNPQAWEPKTWMPNKNVSDGAIQKLVRYLELLGKEGGDEK
jgi:mono/diheme cytochrome c family protein